jgi:hypothetical protein
MTDMETKQRCGTSGDIKYKQRPGRGCVSEFLKLFRHPATLPFAWLFEIMVRQV